MGLTSLRGPALKAHLKSLSKQYGWSQLPLKDVTNTSSSFSPDSPLTPPMSVTKRRGDPRRKSIKQTPTRYIGSAVASSQKDEGQRSSPQNQQDVTTPLAAGISVNTSVRTQGKSAFIICDTSSSDGGEDEEEEDSVNDLTPVPDTADSDSFATPPAFATTMSDADKVVTVAHHRGVLSPMITPPPPLRTPRKNVISLGDEEEEEDEEEDLFDIFLGMAPGGNANTSRGGWSDPEEDSVENPGIMEYIPPPKVFAEKEKSAERIKTSSTATTIQSAPSTPLLLCKEVRIPDTASRAAVAAFKRDRETLTQKYFESFNAAAFKGQLPSTVQVVWNKRLLTTAGITKLKLTNTRLASGGAISPSEVSKEERQKRLAAQRTAVIELSEKVCDNEERLKTTLLHEMCHVASWLLDAERKPPHGPAFWKHARIASAAVPELGNVTTCHSFVVHKPFKFKCTNVECGLEYGRHSKSIDTERHRCGFCKSKLVYEGKFSADGTKTSHAASGFSLFVKEHFATVKSTKLKGKQKTHAEVMQELSAMYKAQTLSKAVQSVALPLSESKDKGNYSVCSPVPTHTLGSIIDASPISNVLDLTQDTPSPSRYGSQLDSTVELDTEADEEEKDDEGTVLSLAERLALSRL